MKPSASFFKNFPQIIIPPFSNGIPIQIDHPGHLGAFDVTIKCPNLQGIPLFRARGPYGVCRSGWDFACGGRGGEVVDLLFWWLLAGDQG